MNYHYSKNIKQDFDKVEKNVIDSLAELGFGVLTEINIQNAFKDKLNIKYKKYKILGAYHPKLAHQALEDEPMIGILMPCNILIIDNENGSTKIVFPYAHSLLDITKNDAINHLSNKVDELLKNAFEKII
ncbi:MAG: hypothetical protein CMG07_04330 [Candidatus Marinimicrobia bacterium]|nr:hypothetical protein [Candidatus Neomarinimicrobiota bacterium]|tara:strand:+ start:5520 stop:5909 length:390 start_codon:yes stop_codon:yes gene_type:complete